MKYVLYGSQKWRLEERPSYLGTPNFYRGSSPDGLLGLPVHVFTDKIHEAKKFRTKGDCREIAKRNKLTGYLIIPTEEAKALVKEYNKAFRERKEQYTITPDEIEVLKKFEEYRR